MLENKVILLTGGTGSFGQKFTEVVLEKYKSAIIRIFSRDELKQWEMRRKFNEHPRLRFFLGDIRDKTRLKRAMEGSEVLVHAAALKQVPLCEYNPCEAVKTNIIGAQNIAEVAIDLDIPKILAISTDKAVSPVNLYGATKMCMEKLLIAANSYVGAKRQTRISCVRYGNIVGSRGSVIPLFKKQRSTGTITITHKDMTRFWLTLEQGIKCVLDSLERMQGGEIFIPKIPSMKVVDLADTVAPECEKNFIGIRPGEKLHECLITTDEARYTLEFEDYFVIEPAFPLWNDNYKLEGGRRVDGDFKYVSDINDKWLTREELGQVINKLS